MTVEWLDDGGAAAEELLEPPNRPPHRRAVWWAVAAVAAGAVAIAVTQAGGSTRPSARSTPSTASHSLTSPAPRRTPSSTVGPTTSAASVPTVIRLGHALLGDTSGWELFARSTDSVVRIQLATGTVTNTPVPAVQSNGDGVAFVVTSTGVVVLPNDAVPGYVVPDGKPARRLTGVLSQGGSVFPGPAADEVWVQRRSDVTVSPAPELYDLRTNRLLPSRLTPPQSLGQPYGSDGSGYLLYGGVGGVYDVRPSGVRRVTSGTILAVGATSWLVEECDEQYRCGAVLLDQRTGTRRSLGPMSSSLYFQPSTISPDGRFAAYFDAYGQSQPTLRVMDLSTGRTRNLLIGGNDSFGGDPVAWAPGGHLMLVVDDAQMIQVLDPATGKRHVLDARIPQASQLAVRPAP